MILLGRGAALIVTLALASPAPLDAQADAARAVIQLAQRAVERDSTGVLVAAWDARMRRDPQDREARLGRALLAALTYDYRTADRLFAELYANDSAAPDGHSVYARLAHGRTWLVRRNQSERVKHFGRALLTARAIGDRTAEAEALIELSNTRAIGTGLEAGLATVDSAASLLAPAQHELQALRLQRRVVFLAALGKPGIAETAARCMAAARRAGTPRALALGLRARAHAHYAAGRYDSTVALARQAEEQLRAARDRAGLAFMISERLNALSELGDFAQAREAAHLQAREAQASGAVLPSIAAQNALGLIAFKLGDLPTAREHLARAVAIETEAGDSVALLTTRLLLSEVHEEAGNIDSARALATLVAERQLARDDLDAYFEAQQQLLWLALRRRELSEARRLIGDLRALARRHGMSVRELAYQEGLVASLAGEHAAADRTFRRYLASPVASDPVLRWGVRVQLAAVSARRGLLGQAARELAAGNAELDRWRASLSDAEMRTLVFQSSFFHRKEEAEAHARTIAALASGGRVSAAFELAERRRARELSDRMARAAALRAAGAVAPGVSPIAVDTGIATASRALRSVPAGTAVMHFVAGGGEPMTLFVLTGGGLTAHILPPVDSLAPGIRRLAALVEAGSEPGPLAGRLGASLFGSVQASLRDVRRLVIVPDNELHHLPWDVLVLADDRRVVDHFAVSITPSVTVTARLASGGRVAGAGAALLAFGDPAFAAADETDGGASAHVYRSAFDSSGGLPRLRESGREARLVARYATRAQVRLRGDASAAFLKRAALDSFDVIHLATHALVDDRSLARTALALAASPGESGFVTPGDLAGLRLDAALVVLSACRTAGGVVVGGEGVQGLTAPLLQAGARSVVATSWRISDRGTVPLVRAFYDALARGLPVTDAMRAAKLDAIARGAPASEWAAFQVVGDPLVQVPLSAPPERVPWLRLGAAMAVILSAVAFYSIRRRRGARVPARTGSG